MHTFCLNWKVAWKPSFLKASWNLGFTSIFFTTLLMTLTVSPDAVGTCNRYKAQQISKLCWA